MYLGRRVYVQGLASTDGEWRLTDTEVSPGWWPDEGQLGGMMPPRHELERFFRFAWRPATTLVLLRRGELPLVEFLAMGMPECVNSGNGFVLRNAE